MILDFHSQLISMIKLHSTNSMHHNLNLYSDTSCIQIKLSSFVFNVFLNVLDPLDLFLMSRALSITGMGSPLNMSAFLTAPHCSPKGERGLVSASSIIVGNGVYRGPDYRSFTPAITRAWPYSQLLWTRPSAVVYQTLGGEGSGRILINKLIF